MTSREPSTPRRIRTTLRLLTSLGRFLWLLLLPKAALAARCLVLEKQLAVFLERKAKHRLFDDASRITLALLTASFTRARSAVVAVKPSTLVRWHRNLWALYWTRLSRPRGRPQVPKDVQTLIAQMSRENPTWGEERIKNELLLKLGLMLSERTIAKYMHKDPGRGPGRSVSRERWSAFLRGHAKAILSCDFFTQVALDFTACYVFVLMEIESRRVLHVNVTRHPTAEWTTQQLRDAIPADHSFRFLLRDRDAIYSTAFDSAVKGMGLRVLRTPPHAPKANAFVERLIGTFRRQCLDFFLVVNERHLRKILREWVQHYNAARPHMSLGPGIPDPEPGLPAPPQILRHRLPEGQKVSAKPVLSGLHNEYRIEREAS